MEDEKRPPRQAPAAAMEDVKRALHQAPAAAGANTFRGRGTGQIPIPPASRVWEAMKKIGELLLPDVRDIPQIKERAATVWENLRQKVCAGATATDEEDEPKGPAENPF